MKVLVTGATGFIGGHVISELLKRGCQVIASSSGNRALQRFDWGPHFTHLPLDLSRMVADQNLYAYFQKPDHLIHLAWEGLPNYKDTFHEEVNLPRHSMFLKNMISHGLSSVTVTGTCLEYGMQEGCLSEETAAMPLTAYARAKDKLRKELEQFAFSFPFSFKWVRLFYMYGPGQNPKSLLSQLDQAIARGDKKFPMSGGQQLRDYLTVEKVAAYLVDIAVQDKVEGVINCCSGIPVKVEEFVRNYLETKNVSMELELGYYPYPDYEPMKFWGDTKKLNKIINHE